MGNLTEELKVFTGSDTFIRHGMYRAFVFTEGVKYLAEKAQCWWLVDDILLYQSDPAIKDLRFQTWILKKSDSGAAVLRVEDGDEKHVKSFDVRFTDFPMSEFTLWLVGGTLLLPSEY